MKKHPTRTALPMGKEQISLDGTYRTKYRALAVFIICSAILVAAFAISAIWMHRDGGAWLDGLGSFWKEEESTTEPNGQPEAEPPVSDGTPTEPEAAPIPEGAVAVVSKDLAYLDLGRDYIHNQTDYRPNVDQLLTMEVSFSAEGEGPRVLILHTHTSEAYLAEGTTYIEGPIGDATYSRDEQNNVLAVGRVLSETLNKKGITAIHCTVMHDDPTLSGSYARSAETVKKYLAEYPSIEVVIDLHRDAVTGRDGEFLRAVTEVNGESVAQVMAVVGSDGNGTEHPGWESNLALALRLREALNMEGAAVGRPVSLRNQSFYQELAPHGLLLEIGTAANSPEEAVRAAVLVGEALAALLQER